MSATKAAKALIAMDADTQRQIETLVDDFRNGGHEPCWCTLVRRLRELWVLRIAARAAGAKEESVVSAVLFEKGYGSRQQCRTFVHYVLVGRD